MNKVRRLTLTLLPLAVPLLAAGSEPLNSANAPQHAVQSRDESSPLVDQVRAPTARYRDINLAAADGFASTPPGRAHYLDNEKREEGPSVAQVVALDECDPTTFNAALGPDFCRNVAVGAATKLSDLFAKAAAGTPDPGWDFEPDTVNIKKGTALTIVDQGGEPHTFTEVAQFGGGFIPGLNAGQAVVPECAGGFSNVAVARTRILQGSQLQIAGLSKGDHLFQCCIHPWMHMKVEVK